MEPDMGEVSDGYHTFNELYEHRHALFLALAKASGSRFSISEAHDDGSKFEGWFLAVLHLPTGEIRYHLPMRLWGAAVHAGAEAVPRGPAWDGATADATIARLSKFVSCG